jgi:hypothetical protein
MSYGAPAFRVFGLPMRKKRADEQTRTADLLITSEPIGVAGVCTGLQIPHIWAVFSSPVCPALHRIAFPVVSEWCQFSPCIRVTLPPSSSTFVCFVAEVRDERDA